MPSHAAVNARMLYFQISESFRFGHHEHAQLVGIGIIKMLRRYHPRHHSQCLRYLAYAHLEHAHCAFLRQ